MTELDLPVALEKAEKLHAFLTSKHPLSMETADVLDNLIRQVKDPGRMERLAKLKAFLSTYHTGDMPGKASRHWDNQINMLMELVRDYSKTYGKLPNTNPALLEYLIDCIGDDLRLHFKNRKQDNEISYERAFFQTTRKQLGKGIKAPAAANALQTFTYGDRRSLAKWLTEPQSRDFTGELPRKIDELKKNFQIHALNDVAETMKKTAGPFLPASIRLAWENAVYKNDREQDIARLHGMPLDHIIGIGQVFSHAKVEEKFSRSTYQKIRVFLAHEIENIKVLNRAAALMTLVFPDYNEFTKYILKNAKHDTQTQKLGLLNLIDTTRLSFPDNDYRAWGELLTERGPSAFFYLRTAHLLDNIPRNEKGKILVGKLDRQLYDRIAELMRFCSMRDCGRYGDLKIVRDIAAIKQFKKECREDVENLPDQVSGIADMEIKGERFGKPGYTFKRLSYNDDRFFVVGRFTKSCEYLDGEWGATVKEGYRNRVSTYYCLFDANDKIIAHTWAYVDPSWEHVILDGFEADQNDENVSKALLEKIVHEMNIDKVQKAGIHVHDLENEIQKKPFFLIGTSAAHIGLEQITTIRRDRGEENDDHRKIVDPNSLVNLTRLISEAVLPKGTIIHANPKDSDPEALKQARQVSNFGQSVKTPKEP